VSNLRRATRRLRRGLGSLRWQLMLSYALVTLAAALTLSLVSAALQAARGTTPVDQAGVTRILQKDAARAIPYLGSGASPDTVRFLAVIPALDDLAGPAQGQRVAVGILGGSGRLIVADACTQQQHTRAVAAGCRIVAEATINAFLHDPAARRAVASVIGGSAGGPTITGSAAGHGYVLAAIPGSDKQPGGVLVAIFPGPVPAPPSQSALAAFLDLWAGTWPQDWLPMVLVALVLGTGIGLLLSYRLIRRTRTMAATVRTWSRGDLEASIDPRGGGELGRLAADLNEMAEQMRNLLRTRAEIARSEERRRMQRDLHDGIKQELFATSLHLAAARALLPCGADGAGDSLEKAQGSARRAQQEVGAMLSELTPTETQAPFYPALMEVIRQFENETGIQVTTEIPPSLEMAAQIEEAVTRVIQEALTNIRRHADAMSVTLTIFIEDGRLGVRIEDNGHGFSPESCNGGGLGLTIMRERAESVGGIFSLASSETGTTVAIVVPVESA
jgi:signal transduction histidine kinase